MPKKWEQPLIQIILGSAVISVAILPFVISEVTFFPGNFARAILFRIIVELMLMAYLGLIFIYPEPGRRIETKYLPPLNPLTILVGAWWLVMGLATLFSPQPRFSFWGGVERMEGFFTMSHYFLFFFILAGTIKEKKQWLFILNAGIAASGVMSAIAIVQHFKIAFTYPILVGSVLPRSTGTLENPLFLSGYLLFFIFLTLTLLALNTKKRIAFLYGGVLLLQIAALFFTDTRGGQIAFIVGMVWFSLLFPSRHRLVRNGKIVVAAATFIFLAAFLFLIFTQTFSFFLEELPFVPRLLLFATDLTGFISSLDQRIDVWNLSIEAFEERPLLGYGPESFTLVMDRFFSPPLNLFFRQQWLEKGLNIILDTLLISGIIGLAVYLGIFFVLFRELVLKNRNNILSYGLFTVFLAYFIQNLVSFDVFTSFLLFFLLLAFSAYFISPRKIGVSLPIRLPKIVGQKITKYPIFITGGIGIVMAGSIFFFNLGPLLASRTLQETIKIAQENPDQLRNATNFFNAHHSRLLRNSRFLAYDNNLYQPLVVLDQITTVSAQNDPEATQEILKNAISLLEEEQKMKPQFSKPRFALAKFYVKLSQFDASAREKAKENFEAATALSPNRYMFWLEWAKSDPLLGEPERAVEHGKKAIMLGAADPLIPSGEAYFWTGIGYIYAGKIGTAQEYVNVLQTPAALQYLEQTYKITKNYEFLVNRFYPERITAEPKNLQWRASLAVTYLQMGKTENACAEVRNLLKEPDIGEASQKGAQDFLKNYC